MAEVSTLIATLEVAGAPLEVRSLELRERLFETGSATCRVVKHRAPLPELAEVVGQPARLRLEVKDGPIRIFAGLVSRAARVPNRDGTPFLDLEIVPALWRLTKRRNCRVFQLKTTQEIVTQVLEEAQVPRDRQDWSLTGSTPPRPYTVQYRETDFDFVARLLSEDGIYFTVEATEDAEQVRFRDEPGGLGELPGNPRLKSVPEHGSARFQDCVYTLHHTERVRPGRVFLRDYDPEKPQLKLEALASAKDPADHALEVYEFPGRFRSGTSPERASQILLESLNVTGWVLEGRSLALGLRPGYRFTVEDHPYSPYNQEYLALGTVITLKEARHFEQTDPATSLGWEVRFEAIPTGRAAYRPPRLERRRSMPGLQTAMTTGPSGEEIHVSKNGEVTVHSHWDRLGPKDDKSSCFVRTSQVALGGGMLLPRVGWETILSFEDGDADRPIVMSRVYNAVTPPPYALPEHKASFALQTATTPGDGSANELRMSDTKGQEHMSFNASYDMSVQVGNCTTESIGNNHKKEVGSNHKLNVIDSLSCSVGGSQTVTVSSDQSVKAGTLMAEEVGTHTLSIDGNRMMMIGGDHRRTVSGSCDFKVDSCAIGVVVGAVSESCKGPFTHTIGAALVEAARSKHSLAVGGVSTESTTGAKIIVCKGGRGVSAKTLSCQTTGALINLVKGKRVDQAKAAYMDVAAGAQITTAKNIVLQAKAVLTISMGGASILLLPAAAIITGTNATLNGKADALGLVIDN